jgi:hypothetical protein
MHKRIRIEYIVLDVLMGLFSVGIILLLIGCANHGMYFRPVGLIGLGICACTITAFMIAG